MSSLARVKDECVSVHCRHLSMIENDYQDGDLRQVKRRRRESHAVKEPNLRQRSTNVERLSEEAERTEMRSEEASRDVKPDCGEESANLPTSHEDRQTRRSERASARLAVMFFRLFLGEHLYVTKGRKVSVVADDLYQHYSAFCQAYGVQEACKRSLGIFLKEIGTRSRTLMFDGKVRYVYTWLAWKEHFAGTAFRNIEEEADDDELDYFFEVELFPYQDLMLFSAALQIFSGYPKVPDHQLIQYVPQSIQDFTSTPWIKVDAKADNGHISVDQTSKSEHKQSSSHEGVVVVGDKFGVVPPRPMEDNGLQGAYVRLYPLSQRPKSRGMRRKLKREFIKRCKEDWDWKPFDATEFVAVKFAVDEE